MTHHHTALYVHAMELVRLGDACVEAYERGMKILKDGIASLTEFEEQRDGLGLEDRPGAIVNATTDADETMRNGAKGEQGG